MSTRKDYDYIALAGIIRGRLEKARSSEGDGFQAGMEFALEGLALELADHIKGDNPRFDRVKFLRACGLVAKRVIQ